MEKYAFYPYDPIFADLFEKEKTRLTQHLSIKCMIEHIGSTAVSGLGGKGIIDIAIAACPERFSCITQELILLNYIFRPSGSTENRLFFKTDLPDSQMTRRTYHLHLTSLDAEDWKNFILLRDLLRKNPEVAISYARWKSNAAMLAQGSATEYRLLKEKFLNTLLNN